MQKSEVPEGFQLLAKPNGGQFLKELATSKLFELDAKTPYKIGVSYTPEESK